jgi:hypothetical protein
MDQLARRLSVTEAVAIYEQAERDIRAAFDLVARAERRLTETFVLGDSPTIHVHDRWGKVNFDRIDESLEELRRQIWRQLVERLELRRFMSIRAWNTLDHQLREGKDVPEITHETVTAMGQQFQQQMGSMLEEAVQEVFEWLRPRGSDYKTNSEFEIGPRVILSYVVERAWGGDGFRVCYHREPNLTALENVFSALDGKGAVTKGHYSLLSTAIKESGKAGRGETEYFRFRCFKNRNLHLEFKRPDLLARLNQIAGGTRLRGKKTEAA